MVSAEELELVRAQLRTSVGSLSADLEDFEDGFLPKQVARFRIQEVLGSGSFGTVYVAFDPIMSRNVAVKVAHLGTHLDPAKRECFFSEVHAAARLAHPNVVTVHEYGEDAGLPYIVYQLVIGPTLEQWMADRPDRVEPSVAIEIVDQVAQGLSHAHARGIVHRDVKPSNIVLQEADAPQRLPVDCPISFAPLLTDFGLAMDQSSIAVLANQDHFVGTIDYMSPEQVQGHGAAQACTTDLYSLGVMMYRLLTGRLPFRDSDAIETLRQIGTVEPLPLRHIHPGVPRDLEAICLKCLEKNPRDRYPDCEALLSDLARWRARQPVTVRPRSKVETALVLIRRAPMVTALSLLIVVTTLLGGIGMSLMNAKLRKANQELAFSLRDAEVAQRATHQAFEEIAIQKDQISEQFLKSVDASYRAGMQIAFAEFNAGRVVAAWDLLERIEQKLGPHRKPGIEFKILKAKISGVVRKLTPHTAAANSVLNLPGTKLIVTCSDDGHINFHNYETGEIAHRYSRGGHWKPTALAIDREGKRLAVGWSLSLAFGITTAFTHIYALDIEGGEKWIGDASDEFPSPSTVESLCFSADGQLLAVGPRYEPVAICNLQAKTESFVSTRNRNRSVEFSPDGRKLLVQQADSRLTLFNAQDNRTIADISCTNTPHISQWSPDGKWIAFTVYNSQDVTLIKADDPHVVFAIARQSSGPVERLAFSPDSQQVIAATRAGSLVSWDFINHPSPTAMDATFTLTPHAGVIRSMAIVDDNGQHSNNRLAITLDDTGRIMATTVATTMVAKPPTPTVILGINQCPQFWDSHRKSVAGLLLAGYADGSVQWIDETGKQRRLVIEQSVCEVTALAASSDGQQLAVGWVDGRIGLIDFSRTPELRMCGYPTPDDSRDERRVNSLQFSPDGAFLAACGDDAWLRVWRLPKISEPLWEAQQTSLAYCLCFTGPSQIACGGMFEKIGIYDVRNGRLSSKLDGTSRSSTLLFDPLRNVLVSGHEDGRLRVHSVADWALIETLVASTEEVTNICLAPCSSCYVSGYADGTIALWDAKELVEIGNLSCFSPHRPIDGLAFAADRLFMLTCCPAKVELQAISLNDYVVGN